MNTSNILFPRSQYVILHRKLIQQIGIESTLILSELIDWEEQYQKKKRKEYFKITLDIIREKTGLTISKIKSNINNLYKINFIDVLVKKNGSMEVKILHPDISMGLKGKDIDTKKQTKEKQIIAFKQNRFKKPTLNELKNYFLEIKAEDESEIMFDYYESKGWKVGRVPMKCWKSATRNWSRRTNKKNDFPNFYDKKIELKLGNDIETLSKYHKHLKKLGWISSYSPSSGMTWRKKI